MSSSLSGLPASRLRGCLVNMSSVPVPVFIPSCSHYDLSVFHPFVSPLSHVSGPCVKFAFLRLGLCVHYLPFYFDSPPSRVCDVQLFGSPVSSDSVKPTLPSHSLLLWTYHLPLPCSVCSFHWSILAPYSYQLSHCFCFLFSSLFTSVNKAVILSHASWVHSLLATAGRFTTCIILS